MEDMRQTVHVRCRWCGKRISVRVDTDGYEQWKSGVLIQKAMPELTPSEREALISRTCATCLDDMFPEDDDE